MSNVPVIAFGPNPDVYYIAMGTRYYCRGMPPSVNGTINKWPAIQMTWMSIEADGAWIARDGYGTGVEFDTRLTDDVVQRFRASPAADYVTFGPRKGTWVAVTPGRGWAGNMEDEMIKRTREMQTMVGGVQVFDNALTGILFGKGTTMIFMFKGGFSYYTDDEAEGGNMEKLLDDYLNRKPMWTVERGSALCPWNVNYFFLKFKDPQTNKIQMHWNLPQPMGDDLADLTRIFETPEAKQAIANHQQAGMINATNNVVNLALIYYRESTPGADNPMNIIKLQNLAIHLGNSMRFLTGNYAWRY